MSNRVTDAEVFSVQIPIENFEDWDSVPDEIKWHLPALGETPIQDWSDRQTEAIAQLLNPIAELSEQLDEIRQEVTELTTEQRAKTDRRSLLFLMAMLTVGIGWIQIGHPLLHGTVKAVQSAQQQVKQATQPIVEFFAPNLQKTLKPGDTVSGLEVTSGYGPRSSPGGVGSTYHEGVDLAAPEGTQIHAPFDIEVRDASSSACGTGARVSSPQLKGYEVGLCHLSKLETGKISQGQVFALTGNTGASTGPHLHLGVFNANGESIDPPADIVWAFVTGKTPNTEKLGGSDANNSQK